MNNKILYIKKSSEQKNINIGCVSHYENERLFNARAVTMRK